MTIQESKTKVVMRSVLGRSMAEVVRECLELCDWEHLIARDAAVVLKPNLCTIVPDQMEKSNTDIALTRAVCEILLTRTKRIYIGEAEVLRDRIRNHLERDFWNALIIVVSKDENLNKAHVQFIESRLITLASEAKRCALDNGNAPGLPSLSEADAAETDGFLLC